ncbi:MAG: ATP-binding protein, partial [Shewanella sp.]
VPEQPLMMQGVPEYIAQLMDKLIANAIEFCHQGSAIEVTLTQVGKQATLLISNLGPQLPVDMSEQIFDSMVSVRINQAQDKPHLGLGLYIARLVTEFHQGKILARNRSENDGVDILVTLPLS